MRLHRCLCNARSVSWPPTHPSPPRSHSNYHPRTHAPLHTHLHTRTHALTDAGVGEEAVVVPLEHAHPAQRAVVYPRRALHLTDEARLPRPVRVHQAPLTQPVASEIGAFSYGSRSRYLQLQLTGVGVPLNPSPPNQFQFSPDLAPQAQKFPLCQNFKDRKRASLPDQFLGPPLDSSVARFSSGLSVCNIHSRAVGRRDAVLARRAGGGGGVLLGLRHRHQVHGARVARP